MWVMVEVGGWLILVVLVVVMVTGLQFKWWWTLSLGRVYLVKIENFLLKVL